MSLPYLSLSQARCLHLAAQGLLKKPRRNAMPGDVLAAISRMALLQIDTINVVARSPYLVLFSRLGPYPQAWLDEALRRGELMEYWAHEAVSYHAATLNLSAIVCCRRKRWAGNIARHGCMSTRKK